MLLPKAKRVPKGNSQPCMASWWPKQDKANSISDDLNGDEERGDECRHVGDAWKWRDTVYPSLFTIYTSRTTQGGGGSFTNSKPIGEVGWCESRMAEQRHWWIDRCFTGVSAWKVGHLRPSWVTCAHRRRVTYAHRWWVVVTIQETTTYVFRGWGKGTWGLGVGLGDYPLGSRGLGQEDLGFRGGAWGLPFRTTL